DRQVGVVPRRLAQKADGVDQHQRRRPAVGVVLAAQPALVVEVPFGQAEFFDPGLDLVGAVNGGFFLGHGGPPSGGHFLGFFWSRFLAAEPISTRLSGRWRWYTSRVSSASDVVMSRPP